MTSEKSESYSAGSTGGDSPEVWAEKQTTGGSTTHKEWYDKYQAPYTKRWPSVTGRQNACPHCGYCPHCGRSRDYQLYMTCKT